MCAVDLISLIAFGQAMRTCILQDDLVGRKNSIALLQSQRRLYEEWGSLPVRDRDLDNDSTAWLDSENVG